MTGLRRLIGRLVTYGGHRPGGPCVTGPLPGCVLSPPLPASGHAGYMRVPTCVCYMRVPHACATCTLAGFLEARLACGQHARATCVCCMRALHACTCWHDGRSAQTADEAWGRGGARM